MTGPLQGFRVVEMGGIGPAPFAGGLLGDLGADVLRSIIGAMRGSLSNMPAPFSFRSSLSTPFGRSCPSMSSTAFTSLMLVESDPALLPAK